MGTGGHHDKHAVHGRIIARLRQQADDVRRLTSRLEEEQLVARTAAGKWSLKELTCHVWRVQRLLADRIEAMLREDNPEFAAYAPEGDAEFEDVVQRPFTETLAAFLLEREELASRLERLSPGEWHRPGRHPAFPYFDVHFQAEYLAHHEAHHIFQMFERRSGFGKVPH